MCYDGTPPASRSRSEWPATSLVSSGSVRTDRSGKDSSISRRFSSWRLLGATAPVDVLEDAIHDERAHGNVERTEVVGEPSRLLEG